MERSIMFNVRISRRRIAQGFGAIVALVAGLLAASPAARAAPDPGSGTPTYWIKNVKSNKCLNVAGASTANNAAVVHYTCQNTYTNDLWYLRYDSPGDYVWIVNVNSGKCLNVPGASTANVAVVQYTCQNTYTNDRWYIESPHDTGWIVNENSNKCLNVADASTANNASVIQYPCQFTYVNDEWYLVAR
jgi:hypothetical protein